MLISVTNADKCNVYMIRQLFFWALRVLSLRQMIYTTKYTATGSNSRWKLIESCALFLCLRWCRDNMNRVTIYMSKLSRRSKTNTRNQGAVVSLCLLLHRTPAHELPLYGSGKLSVLGNTLYLQTSKVHVDQLVESKYHGSLSLVERSGMRRISPTAVRPELGDGRSACDGMPIATWARPTPCSTTTSSNLWTGITCISRNIKPMLSVIQAMLREICVTFWWTR